MTTTSWLGLFHYFRLSLHQKRIRHGRADSLMLAIQFVYGRLLNYLMEAIIGRPRNLKDVMLFHA